MSLIQRAENVKWKRGVAPHPFLFSSTWLCPPSPPLLSHCTSVYWLEIEALTTPGLQSWGQASLVLRVSAAGHTQGCASRYLVTKGRKAHSLEAVTCPGFCCDGQHLLWTEIPAWPQHQVSWWRNVCVWWGAVTKGYWVWGTGEWKLTGRESLMLKGSFSFPPLWHLLNPSSPGMLASISGRK